MAHLFGYSYDEQNRQPSSSQLPSSLLSPAETPAFYLASQQLGSPPASGGSGDASQSSHAPSAGNVKKVAGKSSSEPDQPLFSCKTDSSEVLITMIDFVRIEKGVKVMCSLTDEGFKFVAQKSRTLQAKSYITKALFQEFHLLEESVSFCIDAGILHDCLSIFGESSHLEMSYAGHGHPLCLLLEKDGVITQCEIQTLDAQGRADFPFRSHAIICRSLIKAGMLRDVFSELDAPGAESLSMFWSPEAPFLSFEVDGDNSSCKVDLAPSDAKSSSEVDMFDSFSCKTNMSCSYALDLFRPCVKLLQSAENSMLRVNAVGMLNMTHVIVGKGNWIEFVLCAQDTPQDDA